MTAIPVLIFSAADRFRMYADLFKKLAVATLFALPVLCSPAFAQNTTISGTVYDPRTTASSLPLSNVLVYLTTGTVDPLPAGVQCLTASTPTGVVSYTNTAVNGTFTLGNVPINGTYTLVIQAGKWRRQFTETVADAPLTGLALHMPSNHTQGDIPLIAIATGSVDSLECVLRDMGINDSEFTDDNGTSGGRIHLYLGSAAPGVTINGSTPSQTVLMGTPTDSSLLNSYDVVMFPCQGTPSNQATTTAATNLLNYANTGGRVFATHYSYAWLNPADPYDSLFPPVANWVGGPNPIDGVATINTNFTDGAALAQWLLNSGASTTYGQVPLTTLRNDISGVIAPTQSWATMNTPSKQIMQMTFNTPVGAPAASQCGRILFNEYHVYPSGGIATQFPKECGTTGKMTAQEEMLEYALFDLSSFVTPVVVPTLSIVFTPNPLLVKQGDSADQVTINISNTSSTAAIDGSAVLNLALPAGLAAAGLTDTTGGWICTPSTLTCTRSSGIPASGSDAVTLSVSVPAYPPGGMTNYSGLITATVSSPNFSNNVVTTGGVIFQQQPPITWATPAPIIYGTALSGTQLNAASPLAGSFSYSPAAGTVLSTGQHTLQATFTPNDMIDYTTQTATVPLTVNPVTPLVTLGSSINPVFLQNPTTITATVNSLLITPTGTITFYDGSTQIGSASLSAAQATLTTSSLSYGPHSITAAYSGDSSYTASTSSPMTESVVDFTITLASGGSGTETMPAGGQTSFALAITPVGSATLPTAVSLSVAGVPLQISSGFTPSTVPASSGATNVTLTVKGLSQSTSSAQRKPLSGGTLPMALGLILLPFASRLRRTARDWRRLAAFALATALLGVGLSGCGIVLNTTTSALTVTATSGQLSHTMTVNLIVK